jgi:hypothetical protein
MTNGQSLGRVGPDIARKSFRPVAQLVRALP